MRKIASTALIAVLFTIAPAGAAFSHPVAEGNSSSAAVTSQVQAQEGEDDGGNNGLWGLLGLLGLAGLIPRRSNRDRQPSRNDRM